MDSGYTCTGAFTKGADEGVFGSSEYKFSDFSFSASNSNSIYANSETVQPSASQALIIIKT